MVEQVYYSNWSDKLEVGHDDYWSDISNLSVMIGNDLIGPYQMNYFLSADDDYLKQISSIAVIQTKEKFGEVRVYCRLGCKFIIQKKYSNHASKIAEKNKSWADFIKNGIKPKGYSPWWEKSMRDNYPLSPEEPEAFFKRELESDIMHYRNTYLKYINLLPHYEKAIVSGADNQKWLFRTKEEAIGYIKKERSNLKDNSVMYDWPDEICREKLNDINEVEKILYKIHKIDSQD
jgi:hypothetical protein